jgi:hypothetical protein
MDSNVWKAWMGYVVRWYNGKESVTLSVTAHGVEEGYAISKRNELLLIGTCAWIEKVDPEVVLEVPF